MKLIALDRKGFTLIELLVVIAIIGILAAVVTVNFADTSAQSRDAKRQSDLTNLQVAIEAYKNRFGKYPQGCKPAGSWSGQIGTDFQCSATDGQYIPGLAPDFISVLPTDPKLPSGRTDIGYVYAVNTDGTVYKIMAMNTVEDDKLIASGGNSAYTSPFKSCDMKAGLNNQGQAQSLLFNQSLCYKTSLDGITIESDTPPSRCSASDNRFKSSYALWGGFAELSDDFGVYDISFPLTDNQWKAIYKTTLIICK